MITIRQDSELMTNLVSANPVPAGHRFVAIHDAQSRPACFSLGTDKKLNLIIQNNDAATLVDFGQLAGITGAVQAFEARQSDSTLLVTVCIAVEDVKDKSSLWLLRGIHPRDLVNQIPPSKIVKGSGMPLIRHLYMSNFSTNASSPDNPLLFAAFQPTVRITKEEQLGFIDITTDGSDSPAMKLNRSWSMSTNADRIVDVAFCTCRLGDGLFILYEAGGTRKVQFKIFRGDGEGFVVEPRCPPGVECIEAVLDSDEESVLIMGGRQGLTALNSDQYLTTTKDGQVILPLSSMKDGAGTVKELCAAQNDDGLQLWFTTSSFALQYYTCKVSNLPGGTATPLFLKDRAGGISPLLAAPTGSTSGSVSSILSVDKTGSLSLLQQDPASRVWKTRPFYHASATNTLELSGYTLRLQATSSSAAGSAEIPNCWLRVRSSGTMRCLVNGLEAELSRDTSWLRTDVSGVLNIIFATTDMACHKVVVDCFCAGAVPSLDSSEDLQAAIVRGFVQILEPAAAPPLNPSAKAMEKLGRIKSGRDLLAARTQSGKPFVGPGVSKSDADKAASALVMLVQQSMRADERDRARIASHAALFKAEMARVAATGDAGGAVMLDAMYQPIQRAIWDDITGGVSDAWEWVTDRVGEVKDWTIGAVNTVVDTVTNEVRKVVEMTITLGGKVYKFVLDTVETIGKGVSWVLAQLGAAFDKIIDFLGFVFQWDDILVTTDSMVSLLNAGLDYGQKKLSVLEQNAEAWIGDAKTQLKEALADLKNKKQKELGKVKAEAAKVTAKGSEDAASSSVAFNWVGYQLQHGGVVTNTVIKKPSSSDDSADQLLAGIWDEFTRELKAVEDFVSNLGDDLQDLAKAESWDDVTSVLAKLTGGMIDLLMDTLQNAAGILCKVIRLGLASIKAMGNFEVECPVFTQLWKFISKGRPLTLFNFCALLISIPTTILVKLATGKKPAALAGRVTGATFGQFIEKGAVDGDSSLAGDIRALTVPALGSTLFLASRLAALGLVWDSVTGGGGGGGMMMMMMNITELQPQDTATVTAHHLSQASLSFSSPIQPRLALSQQVLAAGAGAGAGSGRTPLHENIFDLLSLSFETFTLIFKWPSGEMLSDGFGAVNICRWGVWLCGLANDAAIIITRAVGAIKDIPRATTKLYRGILTLVTAVPKLVMELVVVIDDYTMKGESQRAFAFHVLEACLDFLADGGFVVAAVADKVKAMNFMYWGLGFFLLCTGVSSGLKMADYRLKQTEKTE